MPYSKHPGIASGELVKAVDIREMDEQIYENTLDIENLESSITQQSQQIALKADKATEDARYNRQEIINKFYLDAMKGQLAEVVTDTTEAFSKAVPTYTSAQAKFVDVKKFGGHSEVIEGEIISANCDAVVSKDSEQTTLGTLTIPPQLLEDYPLRSAGTAYDYLLFKQENGALKVAHHKKVINVTLNSVNRLWNSSVDYTFRALITGQTTDIYPIKHPSTNSETANIMSNLLQTSNASYVANGANRIFISVPTAAGIIFQLSDSNGQIHGLESATAYLSEHPLDLNVELADEVVTDVSSYFPADTITYLPVEDGGSLTFHQTDSEFPIPNEEDFYYKLEASA